MRDLSLSEELLVLCTGEEGRTLGSNLELALIGSAMAEFILTGHLKVEGQGRKARLVLAKAPEPGHPFYGSVWAAMAKRGFGRKPADLVRAASGKKQDRRLRELLAAEGILRKERRSFLFFRWHVFPVQDEAVREAVITELRRRIESPDETDESSTVLIALLSVTGAARRVFGRAYVREHRQALKAIVEASGEAPEAVKQVLAAIQSSAAVVAGAAAAGAASD
jgi:hypothetical protein